MSMSAILKDGFLRMPPTDRAGGLGITSRTTFLTDTIKQMFAVTDDGLATKGTAALDESGGSQEKVIKDLFKGQDIDKEEILKMMDRLRGHIITAPGFDETFGSAILFLNTLEQTISYQGKEAPVPEVLSDLGIVVLAKTDAGLAPEDHKGEFYGVNNKDKLADVLKRIANLGVRGIKQRLVVTINDKGAPSEELLKDNAKLMAECALLCQQTFSDDGAVKGLVAMSEPEILRTGDHDIQTCDSVWRSQMKHLLAAYESCNVDPACVIVKTSLITPADAGPQVSDEEIARTTYHGIKEELVGTVGGVVFLSGGLNADRYFNICKQVIDLAREDGCPMPIATSASRAIQSEARIAFSEVNQYYGESFDEERAHVQNGALIAINKNKNVYAGNKS